MYSEPVFMSNPAQWHHSGMILEQQWGYDGSPPNNHHYPQAHPRASLPQNNYLPGLGMPHAQPIQRNGYPAANWNNQQMLPMPQHPLRYAPAAQFMLQAKQQQPQYVVNLHYTASPMMGGMVATDYSYSATPITPTQPTQPTQVPIQPQQTLFPTAPNPSRRGPPRKPKRSGHAVWVGNVPIGSSIEALKDHFSRDATDDIESVFLMGKSNCAFVNYRSKEVCEAAVHRFNHSLFGSARLLCRIRRDTQNREPSKSSATSDPFLASRNDSLVPNDGQDAVDGVVSDLEVLEINGADREESHSDRPPVRASPSAPKPDTRYFILKSLTKEDVADSLRKGVWETQAHNQQALHEAFKDEGVKNVFLIFSVNKSGEYFGYARMVGSPFDVGAERRPSSRDSVEHIEGLKIVRTPATATAPRGYVTDDKARGTLFWEAERSAGRGGSLPSLDGRDGGYDDDEWDRTTCRPFRIEWQSVRRVSFQRTKGMKNAWNWGKDVKVARDGTELETGVGERILGLFCEDVE